MSLSNPLQVSLGQRDDLSDKLWKLSSSCEEGVLDCLVVDDCCVECYHGLHPEASTLQKRYTTDSKIIDSSWCYFDDPKDQERAIREKKCLFVREKGLLTCIMYSGQTYHVPLPFVVNGIWPLKQGLLIERKVDDANGDGLAVLFSLSHPLDDLCPVTCRTHPISNKDPVVDYFTNPSEHVVSVYIGTVPLVLMYNTIENTHSIFMAKDAQIEDIPSPLSTPGHKMNFSVLGTPHPLSSSAPARYIHFSPSTPVKFSLQVEPSPKESIKASCKRRSIYTPDVLKVRALQRVQMETPYRLRKETTPKQSSPGGMGLGRTNDSGMKSSGRSPFVDRYKTPTNDPLPLWYNKAKSLSPQVHYARISPYSQTVDTRSWSTFYSETTFSENCDLLPQLCLHSVWRECIGSGQSVNIPADNVFVTVDWGGSQYIVISVSSLHQLQFLSLKRTDGELVVSGCCIAKIDNVKKAICLDKLGMIVALKVTGELELYNGYEKVCNVDGDPLMSIGLGLTDTIDTIREGVNSELTVVTSLKRVFQCTVSPPLTHPVVVVSLKALCSILSTHIGKLLMTNCYRIFLSTEHRDRDQWLLFSKWILCCIGLSIKEYTTLKPQIPSGATLDNDPVFNLISSEAEMRVKGADEEDQYQFNSEFIVPLSNNITSITTALHLVYEDLKLDVHYHHYLYEMAALLYVLVRNLGWPSYIDHYVRDHPGLLDHTLTSTSIKRTAGTTREWASFESSMAEDQPIYRGTIPPGIFQWIHDVLSRRKIQPYPVLSGICVRSEKILKFYSNFLRQCGLPVSNICEAVGGDVATSSQLSNEMEVGTCASTSNVVSSVYDGVIDLVSGGGLSVYDIDSLPTGVSLPIRSLLLQCRANPSTKWIPEVYNMIGRNDIAQTLCDKNSLSQTLKLEQTTDGDDGMNIDEEILKLKFPSDARVREVKRLLQSSKPVRVALEQNPEISDHEFVDLQKSYLLNICQRTLSLSIGRGMFTMATVHPMLFSPMGIPQLNLAGRVPPRNSSVVLEQSDYPADMTVWPEFHNGVAAGLKIGPGVDSIDSTWIVFNQPADEQGVNSFAGFLMALGLNGHLSNLNSFYLFEYLQQKHEVTVVGLLLGIAAASCGSMSLSIASVLSVFFPPLLPCGSVDLETSVLMQTAAMMSLGVLYMNSCSRFIAETLLKQIGHSPGPELEFAQNRECYSLTAGLALGMVALGTGNGSVSLNDLNIVDELCVYMNGGSKQSLINRGITGPSHLVLEGDQINIHVTAPGAIVAFGLIYLKTNNSHVADHLTPPTTPYQLDCVRPDFLMLRALSYGLIMWDSVTPTQKWIDTLIPQVVHQHAFKQGEVGSHDDAIDYQTMSQSHVYITTGCCLALGFKFAGSHRQDVYQFLLMKNKELFSKMQSVNVIEQVGKTCVETVLHVILLALSMVMSGSGDLGVLRLIRRHHVKINDMTYGRHMATHMALGLLFLGGGRYCLSRSNKAVAVLMCSVYPHFPFSGSDNRYHLQALRHFYTLATEPRVLVTRECDTGQSCSVPVEIQVEDEETRTVSTPCVLPEWECLMKIKVNSPRYWSLTLDVKEESVRQSLMKNGTVFVKRHTGYHSYEADPQCQQSVLSLAMMASEQHQFRGEYQKLESSSDSQIEEQWLQEFYTYMCQSEKKFYRTALTNCITKDQMDLLSVYLELTEVAAVAEINCVLKAWNVKLCQGFCNFSKAEPSLSSISKDLDAFSLHSEFVFLNLLAQLESSAGLDVNALLMMYLSGQLLPQHLTVKLANHVLLLLQEMPSEIQNVVPGESHLKALYESGVSPAAAVRSILSLLSPFAEVAV